MIYRPWEDSELLLSAVRKAVKPGMRVLDMGTGTGIIAVAAAELGAEVTACDINPDAVEAARKNATDAKVKVNLIVSDLFENVSGKFDLITFNPPYLPPDSREDAESALNTTDSGVIARFMEEADSHLNPGGSILIVVSSLTPTKVEGEVLGEKKVPWETLRAIRIRKRNA